MNAVSDFNSYPKNEISNKMRRLPIKDVKHLSNKFSAPKMSVAIVEPKVNLINTKEFKTIHKKRRQEDKFIGTLKLG